MLVLPISIAKNIKTPVANERMTEVGGSFKVVCHSRFAMLHSAGWRDFRPRRNRPCPGSSDISRCRAGNRKCISSLSAAPVGLSHDNSGIFPYPCNESIFDKIPAFHTSFSDSKPGIESSKTNCGYFAASFGLAHGSEGSLALPSGRPLSSFDSVLPGHPNP